MAATAPASNGAGRKTEHTESADRRRRVAHALSFLIVVAVNAAVGDLLIAGGCPFPQGKIPLVQGRDRILIRLTHV